MPIDIDIQNNKGELNRSRRFRNEFVSSQTKPLNSDSFNYSSGQAEEDDI